MFHMQCPGVTSAPSGGEAEPVGPTEPIEKLPRQEAALHNVA